MFNEGVMSFTTSWSAPAITAGELIGKMPTIDNNANAKYKTLLTDYIQPMLIWFAQVEYIPFEKIGQISTQSIGLE